MLFSSYQLHQILFDYSCVGIVDRVEDNQTAVILLESREEEVYMDAQEGDLQEGQRIIRSTDLTRKCIKDD